MKKGKKGLGQMLKFGISNQAHNSRYSDRILILIGKPLGLNYIEFILSSFLVLIPHM